MRHPSEGILRRQRPVRVCTGAPRRRAEPGYAATGRSTSSAASWGSGPASSAWSPRLDVGVGR